MTKKILQWTVYYVSAAFVLILCGGLFFYGYALKQQVNIVDAAYMQNDISSDKIFIEKIEAYKKSPVVQVFRELNFLDVFALDSLLCSKYFAVKEKEKALNACSRAIRDGEDLGKNLETLYYNRAMVFISSTFEIEGALVYAESDLRKAINVGDARAVLEKIHILIASRKSEDVKKNRGGYKGKKSQYKDPFGHKPSSGLDHGF